ncbi:MAG TPA: bifunctional oligoribonuclease/PAP phosphatase NrnA [Planctomycetota bacterium]|nr:bifunctional oligoribonuclease/PAP phosphatase NrnA [Planctomycetota bacterium]
MTTLPDLLRTEHRFLLTGHENPDGDCLGAETALFHLLKALGKEPVIVNPDPLGKAFEFLRRHTPFQHARGDDPLPPFDVAVLLDCAHLSRLGSLGTRLQQSGKTIAVIDHHVGSEQGCGSVNYVDATAAATGALVRRLFRELHVPLNAPAAEGIFLSLVADTGWFRYSNADAEVFAMASELVAAGVDVSLIYDSLYRRNHPDSATLLGEALQRHRLLESGRLAMVSLDRAMMERAARTDFDTDQVLEPLRSLEGIEVVALLKERFDGAVKCSLRARRDVDVQAIVAAFGGGGHKKAAGATLHMSLAQAEAAIEQGVHKALVGNGTGAGGARRS